MRQNCDTNATLSSFLATLSTDVHQNTIHLVSMIVGSYILKLKIKFPLTFQPCLAVLSKCSWLFLTSAQNSRKRLHHFLVFYSPISSADFPFADCVKYLVTVSLSVSPDVQLAHCMLKIYVPGGVRAEGLPYHADDGSFVLGAIPKDEASGGRTVGHRNPKYVAPHKGHQFGGPGLNELSLWWKTRASLSFCIRR